MKYVHVSDIDFGLSRPTKVKCDVIYLFSLLVFNSTCNAWPNMALLQYKTSKYE